MAASEKVRGKVGPRSRADRLARLDRRTYAGRILKSVEADLNAHVGGAPTATERLLIQSASVKATRLALLADQLLDGVEVQSDQHGVLAWSNSLRHDLMALGLGARLKDVSPSGTVDRLADHYARPYTPQTEGAAA